jgi:hypothetical protein
MSDFMVWDADDFGCSHKISDACESHDCRDKLDEFHYVNPNFKATLFAIPGEMTYELAEWCKANNSWIELAVHGLSHSSNYECEKMNYEEFDNALKPLQPMLDNYFVKGFKAPGWQISDDIYKWLDNHGWWVADQSYNNNRRPNALPAYVNDNGNFYVHKPIPGEASHIPVNGKHYHTWNCVNNGVYECSDEIKETIQGVDEFKFISEVLA